MSPGPRAKDDRRIDDVVGPGDSAKLAGSPGAQVVEWLDLNPFGTQEARESRLSPSIAPDLPHDPGWHGQAQVALMGAGDDRNHRADVALECNQRASIEGQPAHAAPRRSCGAGPRISSAARRSLAVNGPPVSASMAVSISARSSRLVFSSSAAAMYALMLSARPARTARRARATSAGGRVTAILAFVILTVIPFAAGMSTIPQPQAAGGGRGEGGHLKPRRAGDALGGFVALRLIPLMRARRGIAGWRRNAILQFAAQS